MTKASVTERKWPMPLRVPLARPRLLLSILVGLAIVALLPLYAEQFRGVTRILVGGTSASPSISRSHFG